MPKTKNEKGNKEGQGDEEVKNANEEGSQEVLAEGSGTKSEKEVLLELLQTLKDLGINSIGDLEVKISRL